MILNTNYEDKNSDKSDENYNNRHIKEESEECEEFDDLDEKIERTDKYSIFPIKRTVFLCTVTLVKNTVRLIGNIE